MNKPIDIDEHDLNNINICLTAVLKMIKDNCAAGAIEYLKKQEFFTEASTKSLKSTIKKMKK
jgi:hypothetical protein